METATQDMTKNQTTEGTESNNANGRRKDQRKEGKVAKEIESQTSKLPSDVFLWTSVTAMATSLTLKILKKDHLALFIGQWAAPFLLLGIYNKIVKTAGHDMTSKG